MIVHREELHLNDIYDVKASSKIVYFLVEFTTPNTFDATHYFVLIIE